MSVFERVLLIDDNDMDNAYHEIVLRRSGYAGDVRIFEMAQDALEYLATSPPATTLILLDINMPVMDGFEFARRAEPLLARMQHATVVMLSSSDAEEDKRQASGVPSIAGYIVKPLIEEIARAVLGGDLSAARF